MKQRLVVTYREVTEYVFVAEVEADTIDEAHQRTRNMDEHELEEVSVTSPWSRCEFIEISTREAPRKVAFTAEQFALLRTNFALGATIVGDTSLRADIEQCTALLNDTYSSHPIVLDLPRKLAKAMYLCFTAGAEVDTIFIEDHGEIIRLLLSAMG